MFLNQWRSFLAQTIVRRVESVLSRLVVPRSWTVVLVFRLELFVPFGRRKFLAIVLRASVLVGPFLL